MTQPKAASKSEDGFDHTFKAIHDHEVPWESDDVRGILKLPPGVQVKVLKPELAAVVGAERFLAEIKTTANLQHPHILPLFDSGQAEGFLYYVMPYIVV